MRELIIIFICTILFSSCAKKNQTMPYSYESQTFPLEIENQSREMSYMDVKPDQPNGKTVILFHGKNFNGYYWHGVIDSLKNNGYRVIVPDQIGWGKSSTPNIHYSFHLLAENNLKLLDALKIDKVNIIGHSMGGMLATRFTLMYPDRVEKLILENPIGLEDYKTFVSYTPLPELLQTELNATYESIKKYQMTYYPEWLPEYEQYALSQAEPLSKSNYDDVALANALTYQMIYEQPVSYEFQNIKVPTLLIIGLEDRTVVGKNKLPKEMQPQYGNYPELGKKTQSLIPNSQLIELPGIGHIPHIQNLPAFQNAVLNFLNQ
jgi:pimeloyl-ACP methyl ester carboxylesterase